MRPTRLPNNGHALFILGVLFAIVGAVFMYVSSRYDAVLTVESETGIAMFLFLFVSGVALLFVRTLGRFMGGAAGAYLERFIFGTVLGSGASLVLLIAVASVKTVT